MKTENKYYTPEIEEFCVGFKGEIEYNHRFVDFTVDFDPINQTMSLVCDSEPYCCIITPDIFDKKVRVKHLDREDIEELGWVNEEGLTKQYYKTKDKEYRLRFHLKNEIRVFKVDEYTVDIKLFQGAIKNKSELKRLMKQLGISE